MIDQNGINQNRDNLINSKIRTRDIDGNRLDVAIHEFRGSLINFIDQKGKSYSLPPNIKFKVIDKNSFETLKDIFNGAKSNTVEDFEGNPILITFVNETNGRYGFPVPNDFIFIENNLIINQVAPEVTPEVVTNEHSALLDVIKDWNDPDKRQELLNEADKRKSALDNDSEEVV